MKAVSASSTPLGLPVVPPVWTMTQLWAGSKGSLAVLAPLPAAMNCFQAMTLEA